MRVLKYLGLVLLIFVLAGVFFAWKAGFFIDVKVVEQEMGPFTYVYEDHVGDYALAGKIQKKIDEELKKQGIDAKRGIGIYYDNPENVAKEKLRSRLGVIIDDSDTSRLAALNIKYDSEQFERQNCMVVDFPYESQISIIAGILKAYPALNQHIVEHSYKEAQSMELYDLNNKQILYIIPIHK